jgi:hypothetical protein
MNSASGLSLNGNSSSSVYDSASRRGFGPLGENDETALTKAHGNMNSLNSFVISIQFNRNKCALNFEFAIDYLLYKYGDGLFFSSR